MTTTYFRTRDLAKAGVKELNGSFKDFGTTAPKGERWAVIVEVLETAGADPVIETVLDHQLIDGAEVAKVLNQPASIIAESTCISAKGKPVQVLYRRSHMAIRLAKHLANAS